ncbi:hypothetical protein CC1G_04149 [Coprinopsis cinerea okayama7|uniref:Uncharacterized protein n=1 Tax=Coprinopsis cinerea (strain Okayama-7 / 130 / ATCC MYA-4618 / FGSC 9003) TaxID=240176 RepID=A8NW59_COPC7|nr:hypothetical protein CC1G_04149 [Coprinopsis cinerea okayama7\|eukprot:XP_001836836.1 hypothetical protein CC1G_04149 [Coprinopsis cinerea okayama7\
MLAPIPIASTNPARVGLAGINMTSYLDQTPASSSLLTFRMGGEGEFPNSYGRTGYIYELSKETENLNPMISKMAPDSGVKGHVLVVLLDDNGFQVDATHADIRPICIGVARALLTRRADIQSMLAFDKLDVPIAFFTEFQELPEYQFTAAMSTVSLSSLLLV